MNWFKDIPTLFVAVLTIIFGVKSIIFISSIDYTIAGDIDDNIEKLRNFVVDSIVPTEINWISWVADKVSNPWILLVLIVGIFWLFGYIPPKNSQ